MKIGLFDSGIGGTTILDSIRQVLPNEDYKYIADSAHCPYGEKMTLNSRQSLELTSILSKIGAPKSSSSPAIPLPLDVLLFSASTIQICILLASFKTCIIDNDSTIVRYRLIQLKTLATLL